MLVLWAVVGVLGGEFAFRMADRALESGPALSWGWLPRCPRCGRIEGPLLRLAVLALPLRRACGGCGRQPARQQLGIELLTAALFVALGWRIEDETRALIYAVATVALVAVSLTDLRERLIPNAITYPASVLGIALSLLPGAIGPVSSVSGALTAGLIGLLMLGVGLLLYRRADVFGLGDVKLAFLIGAFSGFPLSLRALIAGVVVGGVFGIVLVVAGRSTRATMPYGPALAVGAYLTWLLTG